MLHKSTFSDNQEDSEDVKNMVNYLMNAIKEDPELQNMFSK